MKDVNSFIEDLEHEFLEPSTNRNLTTALAQQGTIGNKNRPSGCAEMPSSAENHVNTGTEQARLTPSAAASTMLSARTQNAEKAMVQAAGRTLIPGPSQGSDSVPITFGPATEYGPAPSTGPYSNRNVEKEKEKEIEKLRQQLGATNEKANHNVEIMKQKWDERNLQFQETAARFQQVAGDETETKVAKVTAEAQAALHRKDQMIGRLQERAQSFNQDKLQAYNDQQHKYEEERRLLSIEF